MDLGGQEGGKKGVWLNGVAGVESKRNLVLRRELVQIEEMESIRRELSRGDNRKSKKWHIGRARHAW